MQPATRDFEIVRGSSVPLRFSLSTITDGATTVSATWDSAVLSIVGPDFSVRYSTEDGGLTRAEDGTVTWLPTAAETRSLPAGRVNSYELEFRWSNGEQWVVLAGTINGVGGLNDD
ncbi:hypothetical protein SAMN05216548_110157 [Faunimonas pinastri]|uniref:Uncharacterized protein n=1 Tax=Faunimonas pinastri TaxID=1855383 RepID=A0A1H9L1U2_9HYPH|nr:hypothetical protein [Faunimonas pinastri]SER05229.1 hypothetical protein SAMN05216548_110157 [Faunimonas pinastri]